MVKSFITLAPSLYKFFKETKTLRNFMLLQKIKTVIALENVRVNTKADSNFSVLATFSTLKKIIYFKYIFK